MTNNKALIALHTALIDAKKGYETAVKDADQAAMRALFQSLLALHESAHHVVHDALMMSGQIPDESGSFMGTVNELVVSARSAITGLEGSLASFASGEEHVVSRYEDAIQANAQNADLTAELSKQKNALVQKIADMKNLADRA